MTVSRFIRAAAMSAAVGIVALMPLATLGQSAAPGPSGSPSVSPGPDAVAWGGLLWKAPTPAPDGDVRVVIPFGSSMVAVGSVNGPDRTSAAAWRSVDGVTWERTLLDGEPGGDAQLSFVVPTSSGLLAIGSAGPRCLVEGEGAQCPRLPTDVWTTWTSVDGTAWTRIPRPPVFVGADISGLASGPGGLMAIGSRGFDHPRLWTSTDGTDWQAQHLPGDVFRSAHFMDVASTPGGWVIVGSAGGTPPTGMAISDPNGSRGAAWLSTDGQTWTAAHVAGHGSQVELRTVYQGADGLVALGTREGGQEGTVWTSKDGQRWIMTPSTPDGTYPLWPLAADGKRILGDSSVDGDSILFVVSSDGVTWRPLANLGATATMPGWSSASGAPTVYSAFVLPDGVLFFGQMADAVVTWRTTIVPTDMVSPSPMPSPS